MNVPNIITSIRVVLIPVLVLVFYLPFDWRYLAAAAIFTIASLSDWLDGHLARKWDQHTQFGAFFDPVADKLIVVVALALLVEEYASFWMTIPAMIIIGREIVVSALREWMAELGKRTSVAVSVIGKFKTTLQMIAIIVLLLDQPGSYIALLGLALLYVAVVLTLWSMLAYLRAAWSELTKELLFFNPATTCLNTGLLWLLQILNDSTVTLVAAVVTLFEVDISGGFAIAFKIYLRSV